MIDRAPAATLVIFGATGDQTLFQRADMVEACWTTAGHGGRSHGRARQMMSHPTNVEANAVRIEQDYFRKRNAEEKRRGSQATCPSAKLAHLALAAAYARRAAALIDGSNQRETS